MKVYLAKSYVNGGYLGFNYFEDGTKEYTLLNNPENAIAFRSKKLLFEGIRKFNRREGKHKWLFNIIEVYK